MKDRRRLKLVVFRLGLIVLCWPASSQVGDESRQYVYVKQQVVDIGPARSVIIDGSDADWPKDAFSVDLFASVDKWTLVDYRGSSDRHMAAHRSQKRIMGSLRLAWRKEGLLACYDVIDTTPFETDDDRNLWKGDVVELYLADSVGSDQRLQAVASAGHIPGHDLARSVVYDQRRDSTHGDRALSVKVASNRSSAGYRIEMLVPWSNLGIDPKLGRMVGIQASMRDSLQDKEGWMIHRSAGSAVYWFPIYTTFRSSEYMHRVRLARKAMPAVRTRTVLGYGDDGTVEASVMAMPSLRESA